MKMTHVIILALVIAGGLVYYLTTRKTSKAIEDQSTRKVIHPTNNSYMELRGMIFEVTPEQIGLATTAEEKPYAVTRAMEDKCIEAFKHKYGAHHISH